MTKSIKQEVEEDLIKTGFPLEVFVSKSLSEEDWMVYNSPLYKDKELEKSRELDLQGVKIYHNPKTGHVADKNVHKLISHLIIQCKKSEKPWVFFDNADYRYFYIPWEICKIEKEMEGFISLLTFYQEPQILKNHRYKGKVIHKSSYEAFSKPQEPSKIYESFVTVVKATEYFKNHYGISKHTMHIFYPIVVVDGILFSASLKKDNAGVRLKQVNQLLVEFDYLPGTGSDFEKRFIVEVITRDILPQELKIIDKDNQHLLDCWSDFISNL